jgi:hypothetical protein
MKIPALGWIAESGELGAPAMMRTRRGDTIITVNFGQWGQF